MKYGKIVEGKFIDRPNRFIAHVEIAGKAETVHVKNTGRCRELLLPGAAVRLEQSDNPARKTLYDLVAVYKDRIGWINIDSQAPNKVVKEWLEAQDYDVISHRDLVLPLTFLNIRISGHIPTVIPAWSPFFPTSFL